ncbi:MAG: hypothetical protein M0P64_02375 [Candidatus Pacebacteria bacterium]|jgi:hypothetical protein|nr:hypothetical protein [Candidatus Paceibacterota bacterium]
MPKIEIEARNAVIVTGEHGGYKEGRCVACGSTGWLTTELGLPSSTDKKNLSLSNLTHSSFCPINKLLNEDGSLKK